MTTPADERPEPTYVQPSYNMSNPAAEQTRSSLDRPALPSYNVNNTHRGSSHDESTTAATVVDESEEYQNQRPDDRERFPSFQRGRAGSHLTVQTEYDHGDPLRGLGSPGGQTREQASRLNDDLQLLKIERQISKMDDDLSRTKSTGGDTSRSKSRKREEHVDEFDEATNPVHEKTQVYKPVENPTSKFAKFVKRIHKSNWLVRYFTYIAPVSFILLIPLLLGALLFDDATVGGVELEWFMIWLQIVWLTLWCGRIISKLLPAPIGLVATLFTNNSKKWRDMGKQLEVPCTIFIWWLAIEVSCECARSCYFTSYANDT